MKTCASAGRSVRGTAWLRCAVIVVALIGVAGSIQPAHAASSRHPTRFFWVARSTGWTRVRLEQLARGTHIHLYAPASARLPAWQAIALVDDFETRIFPTDSRLFGAPAGLSPVDVALVPLDPMTLGYFDQNDVDPGAIGGDLVHSNHANVLFARLPNAMPDRDKLADTEEVLAHELQHLIEYRVRVLDRHLAPEDSWLNEGLSFYAQIANGFWTPRDVLKVSAASGNPGWPVTALTQNMSFLAHSARVAYGRAGLFVTYLAGRFGSGIARRIIDSPNTGLSAVDAVIRAADTRANLVSVYGDWGVAQYLHGRGAYGYGIYARNLTSIPSLAVPDITTFPFDSRFLGANPFTLGAWGQAYFQASTRGGRNLEVRIDAPSATVRVAAILEDSLHEAPTLVQWLVPGRDGSVVFRLDRRADLYNRVTFVVAGEPRVLGSDGATTKIRLRAWLINVSDNDRPARTAAPARHDAHLAVGQIAQLRQPIPVRAMHPKALRVPAGNAQRSQVTRDISLL